MEIVKPSWQLYIAEEWMIPAASAFIRVKEEELKKVWDNSITDGVICVVTVKGSLPSFKVCPVCQMKVRQDTMKCPTPKPNCEPHTWLIQGTSSKYVTRDEWVS